MSAPKTRGATAAFRPWTQSETSTLRRLYAELGAAALAERLNRTKRAVFNRAKVIGATHVRRWTREDDARLRDLWDGTLTLRQIASRLHRSECTVYWRAQKIGIPLDCPPGFESLASAARRTGFDRSQVRYILRWAQSAGVLPADQPLERPRITRHRRGAGYRWSMIDVADLDLAVEEYLKTETIEVAARRRGLVAEVIVCALETYGRDLPPRPGKKYPWRVPSEAIDAALEARAGRESIASAAKRHGLTRSKMTRILRRACVPMVGRKQRGVVRAEVDRAMRARAAA